MEEELLLLIPEMERDDCTYYMSLRRFSLHKLNDTSVTTVQRTFCESYHARLLPGLVNVYERILAFLAKNIVS